MFDLLAGILAFFYDLVPNYAFAIVMLTLTVMAVLAPLTLKGTRSMLGMQKLQPEMKRIQEMHKGDRQAANEAMMAFYKEHKINPLSGCLPTLMQIPVFFIMFQVISGMVKKVETEDAAAECIGSMIKGKCTVGTPKYLDHGSALFEALQASGGRMKSFGVDLAAHPANGGRGAPVLFLLIGLVVVTGYYQMRQMQSRTASNQMNPQMQMMNRIMPLFSGLVGLQLPGGVSLYFLTSNLFRISQQALMYRFDPHLKAHMEEVREVKSRAATEPAKPAEPRKGLLSGLLGEAPAKDSGKDGRNGKANGNRPGASTRPPSGRVTQPGRPGNAPRKRSKRKR